MNRQKIFRASPRYRERFACTILPVLKERSTSIAENLKFKLQTSGIAVRNQQAICTVKSDGLDSKSELK